METLIPTNATLPDKKGKKAETTTSLSTFATENE